MGLTPNPHIGPKVLEKSRAMLLLNLRAFVTSKKGENLLYVDRTNGRAENMCLAVIRDIPAFRTAG